MNRFDIYVINLDKDTQRLDDITKNLSPNAFIRIPAIYSKDIIPETNDDIFWTSKYLTPKSALAISLSHHLAVKTFLETSDKEYALVLEDDAIPVHPNYIEEINRTIDTAPPDWDIIKLDYSPKYSSNQEYNSLYSILTTALLYNRKGAQNILESKIVYHFDHEMWYFGLNIYNNPRILFYQPGENVYESNNKKMDTYNPFSYFGLFNSNTIRIFDSEYSFADVLVLIFIMFFIFYLCARYTRYK